MGGLNMKYLEKIITKELLRKVLPKETENLSEDFIFYIDEDYIVFMDEGETLFEYNIYKFAFKCKEWALSKGYSHLSGKDDIYEKEGIDFVCSVGSSTLLIKDFYADTEIEAIIKATIWLTEDKALK
jgi:hypothetical protein